MTKNKYQQSKQFQNINNHHKSLHYQQNFDYMGIKKQLASCYNIINKKKSISSNKQLSKSNNKVSKKSLKDLKKFKQNKNKDINNQEQIQYNNSSKQKNHKQNINIKPKFPINPQNSIPSDFIIINDCIYSANTSTQRNKYQNFLFKIKKQKQIQRQKKSFLIKQNHSNQKSINNNNDEDKLKRSKNDKNKSKSKSKKRLNIRAEDLLHELSLEDKKKMFYKLKDDIEKERKEQNINYNNVKKDSISNHYMINKGNKQIKQEQLIEYNISFTRQLQKQEKQTKNKQQQKQKQLSFKNYPSQQQSQTLLYQLQKFSQFQQKLQTIKVQIIFKSHQHIQHVNKLYSQDKITIKQKDNQIIMIQKIKEYNIKRIEETIKLFEKIFKEKQYEKKYGNQNSNNIEAILHSLHSFPSLESLEEETGRVGERCGNALEQKIGNNQNNIQYISSIYNQNQPNINHLLKIKQPSSQSSLQNIQILNPLQVYSPQRSHSSSNQFLSLQNNYKNTQKFEQKQKSPTTSPKKKHQQISSLIYFKEKQVKIINEYQLLEHYKKKDSVQSNNYYNQFHEAQLYQNQHKIYVNQQGIIQKNIQKSQKQTNKQNQQLPQLGNNQNIKFSLKLDLRLDQVVFGQDQYQENNNQKQEQSNQNEENSQIEKSDKDKQTQKRQNQINELLNNNFIEKQTSLNQNIKDNQQQVIQQKKNSEKTNQDTNLILNQKPTSKHSINIPLILTKDRMESLQYQKNRLFKQNLQKHVEFQLGCIQLQNDQNIHKNNNGKVNHFTTLADMNSFIVQFYEFLMRKYLNTLVDNLNSPYGKSVIDKLYNLQTEGYILQEFYNQMNNVLTENNYMEYQRQLMLNVRRCTQYEVIHNRAVFQAFTKCINQYRPYYELQGQVYPWIVSEKGITFYEINQQNIGEVFEKSKIRVLEFSTLLCGLHPPYDVKNDDQAALLNNRREDSLNKLIKNQVIESFKQFNIRFANFECLIRLQVAQKIYKEQIYKCITEIYSLYKEKQKE